MAAQRTGQYVSKDKALFDEAARNAIASLRDGFDKAQHDYVAGWQEWRKMHLSQKNGEAAAGDLAEKSLAVLLLSRLRVHQQVSAAIVR